MESEELTLNTAGNFELTIRKHDSLADITLIKSSDINRGLKYTQAGLTKEEVTQLIRNLMKVSGVTQEDLAEPTFKYILPLKLSVSSSSHSNLVRNRNNDATFVSGGIISGVIVEDDLKFQTRFTETEYNAIVEEFPEFSVLYKEVL